MPETPNFETAKKIQKAIEERSFFIFLATANSKASRWCPWEIGYADSSNKKISIVTTTDGNSTYGNEYLQLYDKIDIGYSTTGGKQIPKGLALFDRITKKGTWLSKTMLIKG